MTIAADEDGNLFEKTSAGEWVPAKTRTGADVPMEVQDGGKWVPVPGTPPPYDESMLPEGGAAVGALAGRAAGAVAEHFTTPPPEDSALSRIVGAAARHVSEAGPFYKPETRAAVDQAGPIGRYITNPLLDAGKAVAVGTTGALSQGAMELGSLVDPKLGRDLNALLAVGGAHGAMPGVVPRNTLAPRPTPEFSPRTARRLDYTVEPFEPGTPDYNFTRDQRVEQFISEQPPEVVAAMARTNPDVAAWVQRQAAGEQAGVAERQGGGGTAEPPAVEPQPDEPPPGGAGGAVEGPSPGMGGPSPRSAGAAATPASQAALTPAQAAEYGSVADKQWLYKSKRPGEADPTEYVPGISPTMAQREQTVQAARDTKTARNLSKEADQAERELLDDHNTIRKTEYQNIAGSDVTQGNAIRAASEAIDQGLAAAYRAGGKVDSQPIAEAIQAERDSPNGKLPPVRAVMKAVEDALQRSDGTGLETDPRQVHGVRRVITYLQSKHGIAENPSYGSPDVQAALIRVKAVLDRQMEPAAPGFGQAIGEYAAAIRAIEAAEALQKAEPKLYDDKGRMQFSRIHRFMNDVVQARDPRAALNPYQSFTEAQMNRLKSLHDDLMRVASAEDLAKARGSDTTPSFIDAAKAAAQGLPGTIASSVVGSIVGGPFGAVAGPAIKGGIEGMFTRGAERRATQTMEGLLRPDPAKFPTQPNRLMGPPSAP